MTTTIVGRWARDLGALRIGMVAIVVALVTIAPFASGVGTPHGWAVIPQAVAPAMFAMMTFVLPLDAVMSMVFMSDKTGEERARFVRIIVLELVLLAALLVAWSPTLLRLLAAR
ncbi:MAG: hypothetical protein H6983_11275 [Ectothiorhodospiraceae bacterium]|nr:hypothetical protein [Chromatiales bacterium]MCP5154741.1 hypothetical protein [Ectothiorhodospiraceae bacterium]